MTMDPLFKRRVFASVPLELPQGARISELSTVLRRWNEPGCHLALWQRQVSPDFVRRLDRVPPDALPSARLVVRPQDARRKLEAALLESPLEDEKLLAALADDMVRLVMLFATATAAQEAEVRLEAVRGDACRKFHVDVTYARLVTTYTGPGTLWVPPEHAEDAIRKQDEYRGPINEMPRFSVGLFGGSAGPGRTLVHRSPAIAGTGLVRLFFCIDRPARVATKLH